MCVAWHRRRDKLQPNTSLATCKFMTAGGDGYFDSGGTKFLGRHLAESALAAGHRVTLFNRGLRAPHLFFADVKALVGDRSSDLIALCAGEWDIVYDCSGYNPAEVRATADLLGPRIGRYIFVSTISVYDDEIANSSHFERIDENAPLYQAGYSYGPLKARCEAVVQQSLGDKGVIVRPGLIVGPHDPTFRFNYWIRRLVRGGDILAPGRPERFIQIIDVRDLADFLLLFADDRVLQSPPTADPTGAIIYNAAGRYHDLTIGALLDCIERVIQTSLRMASKATSSQLIWLKDDVLLSHDIKEWTELPLWIAEQGPLKYFYDIDSSRAEAAGLRYRPIAETVSAICSTHPELLHSIAADSRRDDEGRVLPVMSASLEEALLSG